MGVPPLPPVPAEPLEPELHAPATIPTATARARTADWTFIMGQLSEGTRCCYAK
jgi:hypothetical protein